MTRSVSGPVTLCQFGIRSLAVGARKPATMFRRGLAASGRPRNARQLVRPEIRRFILQRLNMISLRKIRVNG